jgi:uncharacterized membrane protein HdeD (DUF308 family)
MQAISVPRWSSLALRGAASIFFGVLALAWPAVTLGAVTILFGIYSMADGVFAFVMASRPGEDRQRWLLVFDGVVCLAAGVVTLLWPGITLFALIILIGVRALVAGGFQIGAAWEMRRRLPSAFLYGIGGLASIAFGLLTFFVPAISAYVLVTMLGVFCISFGIMLVVLALRLRNMLRTVTLAAP